VILSIHDLQIPEINPGAGGSGGPKGKSQRLDKRDLAAYIFLNDKCLDCLILGSASAQMQND
jgi:hypothetical protein